MKPWTELLLLVATCAAAGASSASAFLGYEWRSALAPGALVGVVVFLVRFLSGATPSRGPWADAFLGLERRVARLEAHLEPGVTGMPGATEERGHASRVDVEPSRE